MIRSFSLLAWLLTLLSTGSSMAQTSEVPSRTQPALDLLQVQRRIAEQLPKVGPTVVCIEAGGGSGSGVIVSADGLVLTAAHVIDKAVDVTIVYPDGRRFRGKSLGTYGPADAGMAQILEGSPHPFAEVAPADSLSMGQTVFAMGHPGGFDQNRGAPLRIGQINQIEQNFISHDAALIGGDSGGPTFDLNGRVIGIHSHIDDRVDFNRDAHIAAFHLAWQSMKSGEHDKTHYSKSVQQSSQSNETPKGSLAIPNVNPEAQARTARLEKLAEQAKQQGGKLNLSQDELRKIRQQMAAQTDSLTPVSGGRAASNWSESWLDFFSPHTQSLSPCVLPVVVSGRQVALATVVEQSGYLVTKASEVRNRSIQIECSPQKQSSKTTSSTLVPAEIVAVDDQLDLALLKITVEKPLKAINWSKDKSGAMKGSLCAAVGTDTPPVGFGIISVSNRPLNGKSGAFLGVRAEPTSAGLKVVEVKPTSPAITAGIKTDDIIISVEGQAVDSQEQMANLIAQLLPGDAMRIELLRDQLQLSIAVKLGDGAKLAPMPGDREQTLDSLTATLSKRRWSFSSGIQHDCAIMAKDCGGPLIDSSGNVIGLNIARAGRIQSYALPAADVSTFIKQAIAKLDPSKSQGGDR